MDLNELTDHCVVTFKLPNDNAYNCSNSNGKMIVWDTSHKD